MTPRALFHPARLARRPVLSTQSDERLVDLVRAGSDPAFETIVERYRRPLMRYVTRLLPTERAEDVVQQSFVKAYEAMRRDTAHLNLRPWLYRIAHNNALNALRDRALRHAELDERLDGVERPDQALERTQGLRELVVAVQALPERQRDAILLRELEGRSYDEIATKLGVTDGAVRQLLNRARNSLRAAAAALVPWPLLSRIAGGESAEPVAARMAEMAGVGAAGAVAAKVCATALLTGAVIGGAAVAPRVADDTAPEPAVGAEPARADRPSAKRPAAVVDDTTTEATHARAARVENDGPGPRLVQREERSGPDGDERERGGDDSSGPGGRDLADDDRSGSGDGDEPRDVRDDGNSGPGGGGDEVESTSTDHSGPGGGDPIDLEEELDEAYDGESSGSGSGSGGSSGPG